ncbi:hypothetical protein B0H11DRAFT_1900108 [Mycena galericulata]|nr:hypothetical protein B0H11DRAFT_1900108 [Mycena galericulata]
MPTQYSLVKKRVAPRSHAWARMVTLFTPRQNQLLLSSNVLHFSPPFRSKYLGKKFKHESSSDATTFIDTEGHFMNLGHTEPSWFVPQLLELLKAEKDDSIEIGELDRLVSEQDIYGTSNSTPIPLDPGYAIPTRII